MNPRKAVAIATFRPRPQSVAVENTISITSPADGASYTAGGETSSFNLTYAVNYSGNFIVVHWFGSGEYANLTDPMTNDAGSAEVTISFDGLNIGGEGGNQIAVVDQSGSPVSNIITISISAGDGGGGGGEDTGGGGEANNLTITGGGESINLPRFEENGETYTGFPLSFTGGSESAYLLQRFNGEGWDTIAEISASGGSDTFNVSTEILLDGDNLLCVRNEGTGISSNNTLNVSVF